MLGEKKLFGFTVMFLLSHKNSLFLCSGSAVAVCNASAGKCSERLSDAGAMLVRSRTVMDSLASLLFYTHQTFSEKCEIN